MATQDHIHSPAGGMQDGHDYHPVNGEDLNARVPKHTGLVSQVPTPPFVKLGNPGPLGLIGFALTTFVLGLYQCGAG
jgi:hypothetical protein